MKKRWFSALLAMTLLLGMACSCAAPAEESGEEDIELGVILEDMGVPLAGLPPVGIVLNPSAPGTAVEKNSSAVIDYSNAKDGYVMVKWTGGGTPTIKVLVWGPNCTKQEDAYQYFLRTDGEYDVLPLSDGNGKYKISVHKRVAEPSKYSGVLATSFSVTLTDEFAPFLRPNQYVDYADAANTLAKAKELTAGETDALKKVEKVYDFVVGHLTYDAALAASVQSGYLPELDKVLASGKGICFDYAALMTAMLRSQGVPCKLVVGYVGTQEPAYHAWINVWTEDQGWVDGAIFFDGSAWQRMDPTFASSGKGSEAIMKYIGDGSNYSERYLY